VQVPLILLWPAGQQFMQVPPTLHLFEPIRATPEQDKPLGQLVEQEVETEVGVGTVAVPQTPLVHLPERQFKLVVQPQPFGLLTG
jgi:hypothetical protein